MTVKRACFFVLSALLLTTGYARADFFTGRDAFRRGDYETAMKELKPEADKGNADAITIVAKMYQGGFGVKKDVKKATELFRQAAELGDGEAQYTYGIARALGDGVEQDLREGLKWLFIAARNSDKAQTYLKTLKMPAELTAEAKQAAFKWHRAFEKKQKEKLEAERKKAEEEQKKADREQEERAKADAEKAEAKKAEESKAEEKKAESTAAPAGDAGPGAKPAAAGGDGSSASPPAEAPATRSDSP